MDPRVQTSKTDSLQKQNVVARIGDVLIKRGIITDKQLAQALELQRTEHRGLLLGQILMQRGFASEKQVVSAAAACLGMPYVELTAQMVNSEVLAALPQALVKKHNFLPLAMTDDWLTVAIEEFSNVFVVEEIARMTNRQVQVLAVDPTTLQQVRADLLGERNRDKEETTTGGNLNDLIQEIAEDELTVVDQESESAVTTNDLEAAATDSPVIKLVNLIIRTAVQQKASDIHFEPEEGTCRVRYRIDGDLVEQMKPPAKLVPAIVSRIKIMAKMDISERRVPQDGGIRVRVFDRAVDLRVSTMPAKHGEKVVMRIIDNNQTRLSLQTLGFVGDNLTAFESVITEPNGILLVTGPTGSGKSTTLYAALAEMMSEKRNISTVEDPVEYELRGVNQFQINPKAGFTFASALRALLRQDPDIVMVGEIRDSETAKLAAEAALTGHFVLSTMHTNDAASAVPRMVNMGVEPYLVAASLRGVLAQRLVRRICQHCRQPRPLDEKMHAILDQMRIDTAAYQTVYQGAGCPRCSGTGLAGRTAIHEMLVVDEAMLSEISHDMSLRAIRRIARQRGFKTLLEDGLDKVRDGQITLDGLLATVSHSAIEETE